MIIKDKTTVSGILKNRIQCKIDMNKPKMSLDEDDFDSCRSKITFPKIICSKQ